MIEKKIHEVFIGTETGTFKHYVSFTDKVNDLRDVKSISKDDEILQMNWLGNELECILMGMRNGNINVYDLNTQTFEDKNISVGKELLVGLCNYENNIITAVETGIVKLWSNESDPVEFNAGPQLHKMKHCNYNTNYLGTGGKENPLKIWDITTLKCLFTAKNLPNDYLQLRVPIWVSDLTFLSESTVATASRYNCVTFYDIRAQRRPVVNLKVENSTYSCITATCKENTVVVGGGKGLMNLIDLRKPGKVLHKYKGFIGAIKDIQCDKNIPIIFSVSLDRRLRVHDLDTTVLLEEQYLKSRLNCLLIKPLIKKEDATTQEITHNICIPENNSNDVNDLEDIVIENSNIYQDDSEEEKDITEIKVSNKRSLQKAGKKKKSKK